MRERLRRDKPATDAPQLDLCQRPGDSRRLASCAVQSPQDPRVPPPEQSPSGPLPLPDELAQLLLRGTRHGIDRIDDDMLRLLALRRRLAAIAGRLKRRLRQPLHDPAREQQVLHRAHRLAERLHLPRLTAQRLVRVLIADARQQQGIGAGISSCPDPSLVVAEMNPSRHTPLVEHPALLRLVPPPSRWKPLLRHLPAPLHARLMENVLSRVLGQPGVGSTLDEVAGRRLGITVSDLGLEWVFHWQHGRLHAVPEAAEASVRGSATDLLLLASRLEDADTLFFQRRLVLTGDTELGLTVRNLLDRMPWEAIPLGLRIALQRSAGLARAARSAFRERWAPALPQLPDAD